MNVRAFWRLMSVAVLTSGGALAQQVTGASSQPADDLGQILRPSTGVLPPLQPAPPPTPPTTNPATPPSTQPVASLFREGSFIVGRTGRLMKSADGSRFEFALDPLPGQTTPGPTMGVMPNLQLMAMENAQRDVTRELHFHVTGMVTEYKGQNCLFLESSSQPTSLEEVLASGARASGSSTSSGPTSGATTQPKLAPASELLEQMLRDQGKGPKRLPPSGGPAQADKTTGLGAVAPGAEQMNVRREGSLIIDRTARLTRSADGQQCELTFDVDGRVLRDPPIVILPNLKLQSMEDAVQGVSRDLRFRVTGIVTEYRGRNYVLIEKVVVIPDAVQQF